MMIRLFFVLLIMLAPATLSVRADVVIFAASSLKGALDEVLMGTPARVSYGGSGALARQILQGAPADIFISANPKWMDAAMPAMAAESRVDVLSNSVVAIGDGTFQQMLAGDGKVATGLTQSVPVGIYAKAALTKLGAWPVIAPRLVETDSARAALVLVARGEVPYGVVYRTDALSAQVNILKTLPTVPELPILYPVALTKTAAPEAAALMTLLQSDTARAVFDAHGFTAP